MREHAVGVDVAVRGTSAKRRVAWIRALGAPGLLGLGFIVLVLLLSALAPWIAPYSPSAQDPFMRNAAPSGAHWFGTDSLGRDLLTRLLYGARVSFGVAAGATLVGAVIGITIGLIGGYIGGKVGAAIAWVIDMLLSFPSLLTAIMIVAALGPGLFSTVMAIGLSLVARFARLARASTLTVRGNEYVFAAAAVGVPVPRIMLRYVLPNIGAPIFGIGVVWLSHAIVTEASLSFLGLGVQPPDSSWGTMMKDAMLSVVTAPLVSLPPGLAITLVATAITIAGDRLQTMLDPRLRPR